MYEFESAEWTVFAFMSVVEIAIIVLSFKLAVRAGSNIIPLEKLKYTIRRRIIETQPLPRSFLIKENKKIQYSITLLQD